MPATSIQGLSFEPAFHGFCEDADKDSVLRFKDDGLTKFLDQPKDSGGSGKEYKF